MESNDSTDDSTDTDLTKHPIDTDSEPLLEKVSAALPREPFAIDVAFRAVALERVDLEREPGERFADWIRDAVETRFSAIDRNLEGSTTVQVDVPPEIAKWARLRAHHAVESRPAKDYQNTLRDALLQLCNPVPVYHVDGDVISPADEGDSLDG